MTNENAGASLNAVWEKYIKDKGADFVYFVDISSLHIDGLEEYKCAVLFGKALSREYIAAMKADEPPKTKEVINTERKMDLLAVKVAELLTAEGYKSVGKLKTGLMPHKTVALRAGLGFIGKNNLLITPEYGCALMLGKVLTTTPFVTESKPIIKPKCGECTKCADICPANALHGKQWSVTTTREEIIDRKQCILCLKCMVECPYTVKYMES